MASKINSSQELGLHTVNADLACLSSTHVNASPSSSSFSPVVSNRPDVVESTHMTYAAGGSNSTMPAAIVCPDVRHRSDWAHSLQNNVAPYILSRERLTFHGGACSSRPVLRVRYIADGFDREWLHRWLVTDYYATKSIISHKGDRSTTSPPVTEQFFLHDSRYINVLENIFTALELAAAHAPSHMSIEHLRVPESVHDRCRTVSAYFIEVVRKYWLLKRESMMKHVSLIPELTSLMRDYNGAPCTASSYDALEDCPLPFRPRDWRIPVLYRAPCADHSSRSGMLLAKRESLRHRHRCDCPMNQCTCLHGNWDGSKALPHEGKKARWERIFVLVSSSQRISESVLRRERLRAKHLDLSLYELAMLRGLANGTSTGSESEFVPCAMATEEQLLTPMSK